MRVTVSLHQDTAALPLTLQDNSAGLDADFGQCQVVGYAEHYTGDYQVTPTADGTTLPTAQKQMDDDITVHPIPYYCVSNPAGGETVYIGTDVEIS